MVSNNKKLERERLSKEILGKFFFDLAKIVFTAMVIGSVMAFVADDTRKEYIALTMCGIMSTWILSYIGNKIIKS